GAPAVEPLIKIAQDQDPAYLAWAKENNRAPAGTYAKTALVLGDIEDGRAVPVLLAKLKYVDPDPVPATSRLLSNLVRMFAANALGRMRAGAAYELGRAGSAAAVPMLAGAAADEQLLVRAAATRALDWLAAVPAAQPALKGIAPQLASQLAQEQGKTRFLKANEELRRL